MPRGDREGRVAAGVGGKDGPLQPGKEERQGGESERDGKRGRMRDDKGVGEGRVEGGEGGRKCVQHLRLEERVLCAADCLSGTEAAG